MAAPQAEEAVWLLSLFLFISLTSFFFISSVWKKKKKASSSSLVRVSWVWFCTELFSWLLHINGNWRLGKQRSERFIIVFEKLDTNVFLFFRVKYCSQGYFKLFLLETWSACGSTRCARLASEILEVACNVHFLLPLHFFTSQGWMCPNV